MVGGGLLSFDFRQPQFRLELCVILAMSTQGVLQKHILGRHGLEGLEDWGNFRGSWALPTLTFKEKTDFLIYLVSPVQFLSSWQPEEKWMGSRKKKKRV